MGIVLPAKDDRVQSAHIVYGCVGAVLDRKGLRLTQGPTQHHVGTSNREHSRRFVLTPCLSPREPRGCHKASLHSGRRREEGKEGGREKITARRFSRFNAHKWFQLFRTLAVATRIEIEEMYL